VTKAFHMSGLSPAQQERVKLTANFLNIMAAGLMVSGVVVPIVSSVYSDADLTRYDLGVAATIQVVLIVISLGLHLRGRHVLRELDA